jgi:hypothetical protein
MKNGKMRPVETIQGIGEWEWRMIVGVNSTMICCEHFCKGHNVPQAQQ